jgi:hypothetical protein
MPPKKKAAPLPSNKSMEELQAEMNDKLTSLVTEVRSLSEALKQVKRDNANLKQTVEQQADEICDLKNIINDRELHARSWSIRVVNLPLPEGQETNNRAAMESVYNELVVPILEGAKAAGEIENIPPCDNIIEVAHILPGKAAKKPVIVRFHSRYWRSLLFRHRKLHAPREAPNTNGGRPPRMKYAFYEDLTRATFKQLKTIQDDERVESAWTVSGGIRFKISGNNAVFKVTSIYDTVDELIE